MIARASEALVLVSTLTELTSTKGADCVPLLKNSAAVSCSTMKSLLEVSLRLPLITAVSVAELVDAAARLTSVESAVTPSMPTALTSRSVRAELFTILMSSEYFFMKDFCDHHYHVSAVFQLEEDQI